MLFDKKYSNRVEIVDFKKEQKKREMKAKFNHGLKKVKTFIVDNKEIILFVGPTAIAGVTTVYKNASKKKKLEAEKDLKELYCYDRSLGHYWKLRRELTNREWVEIDNRKKHGERLGDILSELKVLK